MTVLCLFCMQAVGLLGVLASRRLYRFQRLAEKALEGNTGAEKKLVREGAIWQKTFCEKGNVCELQQEPKELPFKQLGLTEQQELIVGGASYPLRVNAEHAAGSPVLTLFSRAIFNGVLIHSRDFGPGLGKYMDYIGNSYSTRSRETFGQLGAEEQGNGLFLALNQVLNGCQGSAILESRGEKVDLWKEDSSIFGRRHAGSKLRGTSISFMLPFTNEWVRESTGWDIFDMPRKILDIKYLPNP